MMINVNLNYSNILEGADECSTTGELDHTCTQAAANATGVGLFNVSISLSDTAGNQNSSATLLFTINITSGTCDCPSSGNFEISDGTDCILTTTCDIGTNKFRCNSGSFTINTPGQLICGGASADPVNCPLRSYQGGLACG